MLEEALSRYEEAASQDNARARGNLSYTLGWVTNLALSNVDAAGYLAAAEQREAAARRAYAANDDSEDAKREFAAALGGISWALCLNRRPQDALAPVEEALKLDPSALWIATNRADALLLLGRFDEAKAIYLADKDKPWGNGKVLADAVRQDFAELRKFGIDTPDMRRIEMLLGE